MQSVAEHGAMKGTGSLPYSSMCPARNPASRAMRMMSYLVMAWPPKTCPLCRNSR